MAVFASGCSCGGVSDASGGGGISTVSSTSAGNTSSSSSGSGQGGSGGGYVCMPGDAVVFALTELRFGTAQPGEWKQIGMNIDGLVSDGNSTDVCQTQAGGSPNYAHPDGDNGIDNSFGKNLLPIILGVVPDWATIVNDQLDQGLFNAMVKAYCLPPTGDAALMAKVFGGTDLGSAPDFDGTDVWPVAPELLGDPQDPESSTLVFENCSVTGTTFDSGPNEEFVLTIPLDINDQQGSLKLSLHSARLMMTLSDDRKSATGGVLAGVLNTEEVIEQAKMISWLADICTEPEYQQVLTAIRQMSDIMTDGTQNPSATCDGISFGVAFDMAEVRLGDVGPPTPSGMSCP